MRRSTDNREQITVNRGKKSLLLCSLIIVLCSLVCMGCDLLSAPEVDIGDKIDAAVDWERAANISVSIANPPAWGQGALSPHTGAYGSGYKAGYAFTGEFTPDAAYTFGGWRLYRAGSLPTGWMDDPANALGPPDAPIVAALAAGEGSVEPGAKSGSYAITVNITEPVTLVPWCEDEPRITRTDPADGAKTFNRSRPIIIYFAAALNPDSVGFGGDLITIEGRSIADEANPALNADYKTYFDDTPPRYDSYTRSITITSNGNNALTDTIITVTVGTGIKSGLSGTKGMQEPYSFSYRIEEAPTNITSTWSAEYNAGKIAGTHTQLGGEGRTAFYSVDGGMQQTLALDASGNFEIPAPPITDSGVLNGTAVSNVHEYRIFINVYAGGEVVKDDSFKIWNIPGMSVSNTYPAVEVTGAAGDNDESDGTVSFANMSTGNANKKYVLTNDITLGAGWTPIGTNTNAFQGKFYGNGHTITVSGNPAPATYTGVFGYVSGAGAEIRDLRVHYAGDTSVSGTYIGGLAGYAGGGVKIRNIVASGTGALKYSGSGNLSMGGIAGRLVGEGSLIENCYGGLNVNFSTTASGGASYIGGMAGYLDTASLTDCVWTANLDVPSSASLTAGGVAGYFASSATVSTTTPDNTPRIKNARAMGNITAKTSVTTNLGGLIGQSSVSTSPARTRPVITDSSYEAGRIEVECSSSGDDLVGGFVGRVGSNSSDVDGPEISGCFSRAAEIRLSQFGSGFTALGGFAGVVYATKFEDCYSESPLRIPDASLTTYLYVGGFIGYMYAYSEKENIVRSCHAGAALEVSGVTPRVGGLIGYSYGSSTAEVSVSQCYSTGPIAVSSTGVNYSGGLIGYAVYTTVTECWASGSVQAKGLPGKTSYIFAGGLAGYFISNSEIENSYALGDVLADDPYSGGAVYAGGLTGYLAGALSYSFAKGSVTAQTASASNVYAGGIAGYRDSGNIQHCVALGETVIAKGSSASKAAGRVYGYPSGNIGTDNYALSVMYLETWSAYRYGTAAQVTPTSDAAGQDGASAAPGTGSGNLGNENFWIARGFNQGGDSPANTWSMNGIARGYPRLEWQ